MRRGITKAVALTASLASMVGCSASDPTTAHDTNDMGRSGSSLTRGTIDGSADNGSSGHPTTESGSSLDATRDASTDQAASTTITLPAKILCVGDSITANADSWIYPMQDKLRAKSCQYQLIGYDAGPYDGAYVVKAGYDSKRIAAGGFSTTGILNLIKEKGLGGVPDLFVEYLGVNNAYGGFIDGKYNPDNRPNVAGSFIRDNHELIGLVRAKNPRAIFVLMKIENNALPEIDKAIDQVVAQESMTDSPVMSAPGATGVATSDGIHPTAAGAVTLAGPVSGVLTTLLTGHGVCP